VKQEKKADRVPGTVTAAASAVTDTASAAVAAVTSTAAAVVGSGVGEEVKEGKEGKKKEKKEKPAKAAPATKEEPSGPMPSMIDMRVGQVLDGELLSCLYHITTHFIHAMGCLG